MGKSINKELLQSRAEHNDGELTSLREIALHQFDLEKIENLDVYCRHLEILLMQNNLISKIENLQKLKELRYLNLALNNITVIENLEGCESLEKLDLTVNFVKDLSCVESLKTNIHLKELYLIGNPCAELEGYRNYVICVLPQLKALDGRDIEKSERINAVQEWPVLSERFSGSCSFELAKTGINVETSTKLSQDQCAKCTPAETEEIQDVENVRVNFHTQLTEHSPEARIKAARDLEMMRNDAKPEMDPKKKKPALILFKEDGRPLQKNQGRWGFSFTDIDGAIILQVRLSKFVETSQIDVDVHPTWIRVTVKGKILQLLLPEEVCSSETHCERSTATGHLAITMVKGSESNLRVVDISARWKRTNTKIASDGMNISNNSEKDKNKSRRMLLSNGFDGIQDIRPVQALQLPQLDESFIDDPDVPPLC
ncbi:hypothetical protein BJ742DRAFT_828116 [Cladochytrium replicatum]|nr:hypothetical protein BJ742DRAFT_828116 [Cladochytrium replicatum]